MKSFFKFIGCLVVLLTMGYIFLLKTVMPNYIARSLPELEKLIPQYINGSATLGNVKWDGGLTLEIEDVVVFDKRSEKVAELPRVLIHVLPMNAFTGPERAVSSVELFRPKVYLTMNDDKRWNVQSLLKPSDSDDIPFYGQVAVQDAMLAVKMPQGEWNFSVEAAVDAGANPHFELKAGVKSGNDVLNLRGLMTTKGVGTLALVSDGFDLEPYAPLADAYAQIVDLQGGLKKLAIRYEKKADGKLNFNGEVTSTALSGVYYGQDYIAKNIELAFVGDEYSYKLKNLTAEYGGGKVSAHADYDTLAKFASADVALEHVTQAIGSDSLSLDGKVAALAQIADDKVSLEVAGDTLNVAWRELLFNRLAFAGAWCDTGLVVDNLSVNAGQQGVLAASGTVGKDGALALKGRMADFPVDAVLEMATGKQGSGLCSTGFSVNGTLKAPEFGGVVQLAQLKLMEQNFKEVHGFIGLKDNVLTIKDFVANMEQGQHFVNGSVDLRADEPLLDVSVKTKNVRIEPILATLGVDAGLLTGNLDNAMYVRGLVSNPAIDGEVLATDGSAVKQLFKSIVGRYHYENGALAIRDFVAEAFIARITLNGVMSADRSLDFAMHADDVDLENLPIKDDTVDLDGFLNARGHLGGKLNAPSFDGDVDSEKIVVNGEALTELRGTLRSNGKETNKFDINFKQPYRDDPLNYGIYSANINVDLVSQRYPYLTGDILMAWGDIGGLLRMARQDYDVKGQMQGRISLSPNGFGSGVHLSVEADDVKIHDLNYAHMNFKGSLAEGDFIFEDVKLQEEKDVRDKGIITFGGNVNLLKKNLNLELHALKANPAIVKVALKDPPEISGEMDIDVKLAGDLNKPTGTASLDIKQGNVAGVSLDEVIAQFSMADDNIKLEKFCAIKDIYNVQASGDIPVDLFRSKDNRYNERSQMNINVDLSNARLGILPVLTKYVEWATGETKGALRVGGTLEEPLVYGSVKIDDGNVKVKYVDTVLENINLDIDFAGNEILVRNLSTKLGKGSFVADGSYGWRVSDDASYKVNLSLQDAEILSKIFQGRLNGKMAFIPQKYRDFKDTQGNKPAPEKYRPSVNGNLRFDDVLLNIAAIPEFGEGESNIGLDLAVDLGPKIHMYNSFLYDIWLSGGLTIKGSTLFPMIDGSIQADKGEVKYLRTNFKLQKAKLNWIEPGSFLPNIDLEATTRFYRYNVFMKISGLVSEMNLELFSDPAKEKNTIVRMLTLQREEAGNNEVTSDDLNNIMTAGLEMTFLSDVESIVKQTLGLDKFRVYSGKVRSGVGFEGTRDKNRELTDDEKNQYNILVSKYLTNNFMVGYTTSFNGVDRSIFGQYDISKRFNLTYSRKYDLSDKAEDWYGLEYKISF